MNKWHQHPCVVVPLVALLALLLAVVVFFGGPVFFCYVQIWSADWHTKAAVEARRLYKERGVKHSFYNPEKSEENTP